MTEEFTQETVPGTTPDDSVKTFTEPATSGEDPSQSPVAEPVQESAPEAPAMSAEERTAELERLRAELKARDERDAERELKEIERLRAEVEARDAARLAEDPEVYVHLANGDVERAHESDLPGAAGTNALHGYWEKDGSVHHVIGVYPVETKVSEK